MSGRNRLILLGGVTTAMLVVVIGIQTSNGSDLPEIRDISDGTYGETLVHQTIVDKHIGDPKHRYS